MHWAYAWWLKVFRCLSYLDLNFARRTKRSSRSWPSILHVSINRHVSSGGTKSKRHMFSRRILFFFVIVVLLFISVLLLLKSNCKHNSHIVWHAKHIVAIQVIGPIMRQKKSVLSDSVPFQSGFHCLLFKYTCCAALMDDGDPSQSEHHFDRARWCPGYTCTAFIGVNPPFLLMIKRNAH